ncbi:hypothetical protein ACFYP4_02855 [Streptomyces sp. NPDC005551]|uniref:hypothetical protein n=1 Tax=Streptomyces sp. NPDC005551 TaxID=3364725 RepID=UPI0036CCA529
MGIDQSFGGFSIVVWVPEWKKAEFDLKAYPAKNYGSGVDRLKAVTEHIVDVAHGINEKGLEIKHICMEGYARNSRFRREEAGELGATVKLTLSAAFSKPVSYPTVVAPTQLKQFVTGTAKASKEDMKLGVYKKWGELCFNDNNADAYGLARMAEAVHTGEVSAENPYEATVLGNLHPHTEVFPVPEAA